MSKVYFTSDLHFGHEKILEFSGIDKLGIYARGGYDSVSHDEWLIESINSIVKKRDLLWILGDVAMGRPGVDGSGMGWKNLAKVERLHGTKKIILGNHDDMPIEAYMKYFQVVRGFAKYKKHWLTHAPLHPVELRGRKNIHGHVHANSLPDDNYINVCVEANLRRNGTPVVAFEELI